MQLTKQLARRSRQVANILRTEGPAGLSGRVRRSLAAYLAGPGEPLPVRPEDVLAAESGPPVRATGIPRSAASPMTFNWVMVPPRPGSGGHTTIFRIVAALDALGHRNTVYFYDPYGGDYTYYRDIVRYAYGFAGTVLPFGADMASADGIFATSWPTAYAVHAAPAAGRRFYFVQDFEPSFYPAGALASLAENTYRMGFHGITAGRWLTERLRSEYGMAADAFDFGCDRTVYRNESSPDRRGVAFYARSGTARRGTELGLLALQLLAARRPDIPLHLYGAQVGLPTGSNAIQYGVCSPAELNRLYNTCRTGLSLSFTNVSLVPYEMLASGCVPVVNDTPGNRLVLDNPLVRYVAPSPRAIAAALEDVVDAPDFPALSRAAAGSVGDASWPAAGARVEAVVRRVLAGEPAETPTGGG